MAKQDYAYWLNAARRHARRRDDADDLLQDALLAALRAGKRPLENDTDAAWFHGVIRKLAALQARSAVREKNRRQAMMPADDGTARDAPDEFPDVAVLPDSLRRVLVLALSGLSREEIRQVLGISDTALRQRLSALKKHLARDFADADFHALASAYADRLQAGNPPDAGRRRAVLAGGPLRLGNFRFGISDADGNMIAISGSQNGISRQQQDKLAENSGSGETEN